MVSRLSTVDPELDALLQAAEVSLQRNAAWLAAQAAVLQTQLGADRRYLAIEPQTTQQLNALVRELDNEYLDLQDLVEAGKATEPQMLSAFGKARAASAVLFATAGEFSEAVYEAISSSDEPSTISLIARKGLDKHT
jgi:hypothetical protein